jgi:hypothetical protein
MRSKSVEPKPSRRKRQASLDTVRYPSPAKSEPDETTKNTNKTRRIAERGRQMLKRKGEPEPPEQPALPPILEKQKVERAFCNQKIRITGKI